MILTLNSLVGTPKQLAFVMGLILQASKDTGRSFLPPMKGSILTKGSARVPIIRYIWSLFPVAHWAGKDGNFETNLSKDLHHPVDVPVLNPGYIEHATNHLKEAYPNSQASSFAVSELTDTLWLDVNAMSSYAQLVKTLSQPYFSTTLVVTVENVEMLEGKWDLKREYSGLELCYESILEGEGEGEIKKECGKLCSRSPELEKARLNKQRAIDQ